MVPRDEFVELHNVGTSSVDLDGMRLATARPGDQDGILQIWSESTLIPAGGYYLLGHSTRLRRAGCRYYLWATSTTVSSLAAGGGLALRQGAANTGTIVDSVGYGTATNAFVETTRTAAPAANSARARGARDVPTLTTTLPISWS